MYVIPIRDGDRQGIDSPLELRVFDDSTLEGCACVVPIALPPSCAFREHQIVRLEAQCDRGGFAPRPWRNHRSDQTLLPTDWGLRRLWTDAVSVVAIGAVERGAIAERALDVVGSLRVQQWVDIGLHRGQQLLWWVGMTSKNRLAADHHDLLRTSDTRGDSDYVLEFLAAQGPGLPNRFQDLEPLGLGEQTRERRVLAQITRELVV